MLGAIANGTTQTALPLVLCLALSTAPRLNFIPVTRRLQNLRSHDARLNWHAALAAVASPTPRGHWYGHMQHATAAERQSGGAQRPDLRLCQPANVGGGDPG